MHTFSFFSQHDLRFAANTLKDFTDFETDSENGLLKVQGDLYRDLLSKRLDEKRIGYGYSSTENQKTEKLGGLIDIRSSLYESLHWIDDALISTENAVKDHPGEAKFVETNDRLLELKAQFWQDIDRVLEPIKDEIEAEDEIERIA